MTTMIPFSELGLMPKLLSVLAQLGYEMPTPVQEKSIPVLIEGRDLLAQAQTGTGKTAAFALPILSKIKLKTSQPQALVIAPTRELAIQVAEAFQAYAKALDGFRVTPIYGGQDYKTQLRALKRGAHVVVGTPGRIMDHMRRGTLSLKSLKTLVLDEADEMLNMGFIEDIEWILEQVPAEHQTALFSATMPATIQKISKRYLKDAVKVHIKASTSTVDAIKQQYIHVAKHHKLEALTRFLEVDDVKAAIVFTRTKTMSTEVAEKLQARGYAAAALNGDMQQNARKKVIDRIKQGDIDIVVATDVAARGIDIERITHVINFDMPHDTEAYIHRIGRTGRAGRKGTAILFVAPRESRLLNDLQKITKKSIKQIEAPSIKEMHLLRNQALGEKIVAMAQKHKKLTPYRVMVEEIMADSGLDAADIAAALTCLMQQANPLSAQDIDISTPVREEEPRSKSRRRRQPRVRREPFKRRRPNAKSGDKRKRRPKK